MDFLNPSKTVPFPTIVLCNMNPFTDNRSAFEASDTILPEDYFKKVLEVTTCNKCSGRERKRIQKHKTTLMSNRGYYQNVGKDAMAEVSHKNLVVRCMAIIEQSSSYVVMPCDEHTETFMFVHADYGLCHGYNTRSSPDNIVLGYSFLLHLDSSFENPNTVFDPLLLASSGRGALIYAPDPNLVPHWFGYPILSPPGQATLNLISTTKVE